MSSGIIAKSKTASNNPRMHFNQAKVFFAVIVSISVKPSLFSDCQKIRRDNFDVKLES